MLLPRILLLLLPWMLMEPSKGLAGAQPPEDGLCSLQKAVDRRQRFIPHENVQKTFGGTRPAGSPDLLPSWIRRVALVFHGHYYRRQVMQHTGMLGCSNYFLHADHIDKHLVAPLLVKGVTVDTYFHTYSDPRCQARDEGLVARLKPKRHEFSHALFPRIVDSYIRALKLLLNDKDAVDVDFVVLSRFDVRYRALVTELNIDWNRVNLPFTVWWKNAPQWYNNDPELHHQVSDLFFAFPHKRVELLIDALNRSGSRFARDTSGEWVFHPLEEKLGRSALNFIDNAFDGLGGGGTSAGVDGGIDIGMLMNGVDGGVDTSIQTTEGMLMNGVDGGVDTSIERTEGTAAGIQWGADGFDGGAYKGVDGIVNGSANGFRLVRRGSTIELMDGTFLGIDRSCGSNFDICESIPDRPEDGKVEALQWRNEQLERSLQEIHDSISRKGNREKSVLAEMEVAKLPFERNWAHLPTAPRKFFIEVGSNSRNFMQDEVDLNAENGFLLTFEPLLDKYAFLLLRHGGTPDTRTQIGLQHERGLVLPYAVGCEETADFHVADVDGCSSLRRMRGDAFSADTRNVNWEAWVDKTCAHEAEERTVPCVTLETVIGSWLGGQDVAFAKLDAQGFELEVVKSAGAQLSKLKKVQMEMICDHAAKLYVDQANCSAVHAEMLRLGFNADFDTAQCQSCNTEMDVIFTRS